MIIWIYRGISFCGKYQRKTSIYFILHPKNGISPFLYIFQKRWRILFFLYTFSQEAWKREIGF